VWAVSGWHLVLPVLYMHIRQSYKTVRARSQPKYIRSSGRGGGDLGLDLVLTALYVPYSLIVSCFLRMLSILGDV